MSNLTMIYAKRLHRMFLSQDADYKRGYLEACQAENLLELSRHELQSIIRNIISNAVYAKKAYYFGRAYALREIIFNQSNKLVGPYEFMKGSVLDGRKKI